MFFYKYNINISSVDKITDPTLTSMATQVSLASTFTNLNIRSALGEVKDTWACADFQAFTFTVYNERTEGVPYDGAFKARATNQLVVATKAATEADKAAKAALKVVEVAGIDGAVYEAFKAIANTVSEAVNKITQADFTGYDDATKQAVEDAISAAFRVVFV